MKDWRDTHWTLDSETVKITELINFLGDDIINIKISDLPRRLPTKKDRVDAANLDYPIIVLKIDGQYQCVLDGNHRLQKAVNKKKDTIKARVLSLDGDKIPKVFKKVFG
tara:strand:- start:686 stop:1012 length:327 start_codon:yes stop_codon:yes gene_type:complete